MGPHFNYEQFGDSTCPITGHLCTLACPQYTITDSHSVPSNKAGCGACMNMNRNFTSIKGVTWESPKESGPLDAGPGTGLAQVHGYQFCPLWPVIYKRTRMTSGNNENTNDRLLGDINRLVVLEGVILPPL